MSDLFGFDDVQKNVVSAPTDIKPPLEAISQTYAHRPIFGHDPQLDQLDDIVTSDRRPHALLFHGPDGIGKRSIAERVAWKLQGSEANRARHLKDIRQERGFYSDLHIVKRNTEDKTKPSKTISVEQIRQLLKFASMKPVEDNSTKIIIIDGAEYMTIQAQNALLKVLEEPYGHALFILVTHKLDMLLPTIRSRVLKYSFNTLDEDDFNKSIQPLNISESNNSDLLKVISDFSPGNYKSLQEQGGTEYFNAFIDMLNKTPIPYKDKHLFAEAYASPVNSKNWASLSSQIIWFIDYIVLNHPTVKTESQTIFGENFKNVQSNLYKLSLIELSDLNEDVKEILKRSDGANLDKRMAIIQTFQKIEAKLSP